MALSSMQYLSQKDRVPTPVQLPPGWNNRSRTQRLFENVPLFGTRWLFYRSIKAELRSRTEDVLRLWEPFEKNGFNCVEWVLKPIMEAGWPNHFFVPSDDFQVLSGLLEPGDVLNNICVRCGVGKKGKNRLSDWLLYMDGLPRYVGFTAECYSGTVGELVTYIQAILTFPPKT